MTKKTVLRFLVFAACCLLLAGLLAGGALAQPFGVLQVEGGMISGGGYRLTTTNWQVSGTVTGVGYRLFGPDLAGAAGSGCCCTYLPCVTRQY